MYLRLPPRIKVLEALGAIADGRIKIIDGYRAQVVSSEGDRIYDVYVDVSKGQAYSNDNGTKYRGYVGYPIIALLMIKGVIPFYRDVAEALKGIPWRELNEKYKKYAIVESIVKDIARKRGISPSYIDLVISRVLSTLKTLRLKLLPSMPS